jgi:hypothetical protein
VISPLSQCNLWLFWARLSSSFFFLTARCGWARLPLSAVSSSGPLTVVASSVFPASRPVGSRPRCSARPSRSTRLRIWARGERFLPWSARSALIGGKESRCAVRCVIFLVLVEVWTVGFKFSTHSVDLYTREAVV